MASLVWLRQLFFYPTPRQSISDEGAGPPAQEVRQDPAENPESPTPNDSSHGDEPGHYRRRRVSSCAVSEGILSAGWSEASGSDPDSDTDTGRAGGRGGSPTTGRGGVSILARRRIKEEQGRSVRRMASLGLLGSSSSAPGSTARPLLPCIGITHSIHTIRLRREYPS